MGVPFFFDKMSKIRLSCKSRFNYCFASREMVNRCTSGPVLSVLCRGKTLGLVACLLAHVHFL